MKYFITPFSDTNLYQCLLTTHDPCSTKTLVKKVSSNVSQYGTVDDDSVPQIWGVLSRQCSAKKNPQDIVKRQLDALSAQMTGMWTPSGSSFSGTRFWERGAFRSVYPINLKLNTRTILIIATCIPHALQGQSNLCQSSLPKHEVFAQWRRCLFHPFHRDRLSRANRRLSSIFKTKVDYRIIMMQVPQQAKLEVTVKSSKSKKSQRQANSRHLQRCAGHRIQNNKLS